MSEESQSGPLQRIVSRQPDVLRINMRAQLGGYIYDCAMCGCETDGEEGGWAVPYGGCGTPVRADASDCYRSVCKPCHDRWSAWDDRMAALSASAALSGPHEGAEMNTEKCHRSPLESIVGRSSAQEARMPTNINCQCYRKGQCMHADAPRGWFRRTLCVLEFPPTDPRTPNGCALQYPHKRPDGFPLPQPPQEATAGKSDK